MRVVVVSCLLTLTACIGEPFTIGEIVPTDGGPVLAELAPDAVVARDSGAADPPDVSAVGTSQDGAANAFPDAGAEVDARRAEPPEAGSESEASTTPEAATPEDATLEAEPLDAREGDAPTTVLESGTVPSDSSATPDGAGEVDSDLYPGATRCVVTGGQTLQTYYYAPDSGPGPSPTLEWIDASCGIDVCCPLVTDPSMTVPPLVPYCTSLQTDPINCGGCGVTCESGHCASGTCQ